MGCRGRGRRTGNARRASLSAVGKGKAGDQQIFLHGDPTPIIIAVTATTTVAQACILIRHQLQLRNDGDCYLYEHVMGGMRQLGDGTVLKNVIDLWPSTAADGTDTSTHRLVYRNLLSLPEAAFEREVQSCVAPNGPGWAALRLEFFSARFNVVSDYLPVAADLIAQLSAFAVHGTEGAYRPDELSQLKTQLKTHFPSRFARKQSSSALKALEELAVQLYFDMPHDMVKARLGYIAAARAACTAYGAFFFDGTVQANLERGQGWMGPAYQGIWTYFRDGNDVKSVFHDYQEISTWAVSSDGESFQYTVGDDVLVTIVTHLAPEIHHVVEAYVSEELAELDGVDTKAQRRKSVLVVGKLDVGNEMKSELTELAAAFEEAEKEAAHEEVEEPEPNKALPAGWDAAVDPKSGRQYYYNSARRMSTWNLPAVSEEEEPAAAAAGAASTPATILIPVAVPSSAVKAVDDARVEVDLSAITFHRLLTSSGDDATVTLAGTVHQGGEDHELVIKAWPQASELTHPFDLEAYTLHQLWECSWVTKMLAYWESIQLPPSATTLLPAGAFARTSPVRCMVQRMYPHTLASLRDAVKAAPRISLFLRIARDLVKGALECKAQGIAPLRMSSSTVLLNEDCRCRLSGFEHTMSTVTLCGQVHSCAACAAYQSPDLLNAVRTRASDVVDVALLDTQLSWGIAMLLWELAAGRYPLPGYPASHTHSGTVRIPVELLNAGVTGAFNHYKVLVPELPGMVSAVLGRAGGFRPGLETMLSKFNEWCAANDQLDSQYEYVDETGAVQGPFGWVAIKAWYEDGYFADSTMIRRHGEPGEHTSTLRSRFPVGSEFVEELLTAPQ